MAELYKKNSDAGFHIVALECQGSAEAAITSMCKDKGVTYQVTTGGDIKGSNVSGIPHGFLFGADGKLVCEPHPREVAGKIKDLLKETSAAMAGPGPYVKLASLAAQVKAGSGLGTVLKTLRTKKDSKDPVEAKEAQMMLEALGGSAQSALDRAIQSKASSPCDALASFDKVALQYAGDEIGTTAKTEAEALRKDPKVKKEVDGETMYRQIEQAQDQMKAFHGSKNPKDEGFKKLNSDVIVSVLGACKTLLQRYPDTEAAKKATTLMEQYR